MRSKLLRSGGVVLFAAVLLLAVFVAVGNITVDAQVSDAPGDETKYEYYVMEDDFTSKNEADWSYYQRTYTSVGGAAVDPIVIDGNITFNNDYMTADYEGARLMSNVYFSAPSAEEVVFDITFSSRMNGLEHRQSGLSWGLLFGMVRQDSSIGDGCYFRIDAFSRLGLYSGGKKIEPVYKTELQSEALDAYFDPNAAKMLKLRLVGFADRLDVYIDFVGMNNTYSIDDLYMQYYDISCEGYLGYTSHSERLPAFPEAYGISIFSSIAGNTRITDEYEIVSVQMDETSLRTAIVSNNPTILSASTQSRPNLNAYKKGVLFTVESGNALIKNGNQLYINAPGKIVVRAAALRDLTVYDEYEIDAIDLQIESVEIRKEGFEHVTVYTQPIDLVATVKCNSYMAEHSAVEFSVVYGPAEISQNGGQLRILGKGEICIKAQSVFKDSAADVLTFSVTDPDENNLPDTVDKTAGCGSVVQGGAGFAAAAAVLVGAVVCLTLRKKARK